MCVYDGLPGYSCYKLQIYLISEQDRVLAEDEQMKWSLNQTVQFICMFELKMSLAACGFFLHVYFCSFSWILEGKICFSTLHFPGRHLSSPATWCLFVDSLLDAAILCLMINIAGAPCCQIIHNPSLCIAEVLIRKQI